MKNIHQDDVDNNKVIKNSRLLDYVCDKIDQLFGFQFLSCPIFMDVTPLNCVTHGMLNTPLITLSESNRDLENGLLAAWDVSNDERIIFNNISSFKIAAYHQDKWLHGLASISYHIL